MSISTEIQRLQNAKAEIKSAIEEKGVEVGDGTIDTYAEKIGEISTGDGGYDEGYEAGQKAEYDRFWDSYLGGAYVNDGSNRFAGFGWTNETFKPNKALTFTNWYMTFRSSGINGDLVEILDNLGITLSTANANTLQYAFSATQFTRLGEIDCRNSAALYFVFDGSTKLETIDLLILKNDGTNTFNAVFNSCSALKNITIEGVIGNNIDFKSCPLLTHDSLMSIINALKDFSGTTTTKTLTLHANSKALLTDTEKAIATQKGWTIA